MKTKAIWFALIPLIFIIGGVILFRIPSSSLSVFSDLPVYEVCDYHFQYPTKWKVEPKKGCSAEIRINGEKDDPFDYMPQTYVQLLYNPQDVPVTLDEIIKEKGKPTKKFTKEGFEAILYREEYGFDDDAYGNESINYNYFAQKGNTIINISTHNGLGFRDYIKGEEIYKSFRFLK